MKVQRENADMQKRHILDCLISPNWILLSLIPDRLDLFCKYRAVFFCIFSVFVYSIYVSNTNHFQMSSHI